MIVQLIPLSFLLFHGTKSNIPEVENCPNITINLFDTPLSSLKFIYSKSCPPKLSSAMPWTYQHNDNNLGRPMFCLPAGSTLWLLSSVWSSSPWQVSAATCTDPDPARLLAPSHRSQICRQHSRSQLSEKSLAWGNNLLLCNLMAAWNSVVPIFSKWEELLPCLLGTACNVPPLVCQACLLQDPARGETGVGGEDGLGKHGGDQRDNWVASSQVCRVGGEEQTSWVNTSLLLLASSLSLLLYFKMS